MKFLSDRQKSMFARSPSREIFDDYEERFPSHQNAIDLLQGWNTAFPANLELNAGKLHLYCDPRVQWAIGQLPDLRGRRILELGPLDGGHTSALAKTGASIDAIEANKNAFLRSLVSKEIYGLTNVRVLLGDFIKWLERSSGNYDLIFACGVLYHMNDPLRLLRAMAQRSQNIYLWTICVTDEKRKVSRVEELEGRPIRLYIESYHGVNSNDDFSGGMQEVHYWMHRDDIVVALETLGFTSINIADEAPNIHGPVIGLVASKSNAAK